MYIKTDKLYIYYKFNNIYYKVPTHGYIFKIIDFGRAIFTFHKKTFFNDTFYKHGEAGGQYTYPKQVDFIKIINDNDIINPNYNFDLCRLSMTILEELNMNNYSDDLIQFLQNICLNNNNESFSDMEDNFSLYIKIAKTACNSLPHKIIFNKIFNNYRIKKKLFPRKSYFTI